MPSYAKANCSGDEQLTTFCRMYGMWIYVLLVN